MTYWVRSSVETEFDVSSPPEWSAAVARVVAHFGGLNVLVNNAGVLHRAPLGEETAEGFERAWRVNTLGPFLGITAVLEHLRGLDEVAYLRFASVYKDFDAAADFQRELVLLKKLQRS